MHLAINNNTQSGNQLLDDFPFKSRFINIDGFEMHYIDEGPKKANPIVLLHGVPTWSYLYRKVIPVLVLNGHRVIAPDLIGFGKSNKPEFNENDTFDKLSNHLELFLKKLNLDKIVLFGHDWGAILGLRLAVSNKERFSGLIISNGYIPRENLPTPLIFNVWKLFTKYSPYLPIGRIISFGSNTKLSRRERQNYDYPFKSSSQKNALRHLPQLLPFKSNTKDDIIVKEVWVELEEWEKPFLTVFSKNDPITKGGEKILQRHIPGAVDQNHKILKGGHFIIEDQPEEVAEIIHQFAQIV